MILCKNCGKQLMDNAEFCINCGQKVELQVNAEGNNEGAEMQNAQVQEQQMMNSNQMPEQQQMNYNQMPGQQQMYNNQMYNQQMPGYGYQVPTKKPLSPKAKKGIIAGIIAFFVVVVAVIATIIVVSGINKEKAIKAKTVDLSEYIKVSYSGYDGYGTATYSVDHEGLEKAFIKAQEKNSKAKETEKLYIASALTYMVSVELSKDDELANGDKIEVSIEISDDIYLETADIIAEKVEYSVEVKDLKEVTKINLFDYIEVTFDGIDGDVTATIKNTATDEFLSSVYFDYTSRWYLSVGDKVTVTIYDSEISNALEKGYAFTETSKDYVVSGVDYYTNDFDELSDDVVTQMNTKAEDIISEYFEDYSNIDASNIKLVGSYFLVNEEKSDWYYSQNYYYPVYSVDVTSSNGKFETTTIYCTVEIYSILNKTSGDVTFKNATTISGYTDLKSSAFYSVRGYNSLDEVLEKCVTERSGSLKLESKIGDVK